MVSCNKQTKMQSTESLGALTEQDDFDSILADTASGYGLNQAGRQQGLAKFEESLSAALVQPVVPTKWS